MPGISDDVLRELFITGLRNAHALEHEALALMDRQIDRAMNYPEVAERLSLHRTETEEQIARLDALLREFGESASGLKDAVLSLFGNMAALSHGLAGDEVLKNAFANHAFENFEVASYTSLITLAEHGGFVSALEPLGQTLEEEKLMASWVLQSLPTLTMKFVALAREGENASR